MFVKSENQNYLLYYKYTDENHALVNIINIENGCVLEENKIVIKSSIGGDRLSISDDGEYIVSAIYDKKMYIYDKKHGYREKAIATKWCIDNVEIINYSIYIIYSNGDIDTYSFDGTFMENKKNVELLQIDSTGEQYMVEDSYVKLSSHKIKPIRFTLFNNVIFTKGEVIVSEMNGRIACYDYSGKLFWEYLSDDISLRIGKISYLIDSNRIGVNIYFIKQNNKKEKLVFFDLENGKIVYEYEIDNKDYIFCNQKAILVDSNLNVISINSIINNC